MFLLPVCLVVCLPVFLVGCLFACLLACLLAHCKVVPRTHQPCGGGRAAACGGAGGLLSGARKREQGRRVLSLSQVWTISEITLFQSGMDHK